MSEGADDLDAVGANHLGTPSLCDSQLMGTNFLQDLNLFLLLEALDSDLFIFCFFLLFDEEKKSKKGNSLKHFDTFKY